MRIRCADLVCNTSPAGKESECVILFQLAVLSLAEDDRIAFKGHTFKMVYL